MALYCTNSANVHCVHNSRKCTLSQVNDQMFTTLMKYMKFFEDMQQMNRSQSNSNHSLAGKNISGNRK